MTSSPLSAGLDIAGMYANAAMRPMDKTEDLLNYRVDSQGKIDIGAIDRQKYGLNALQPLSYVAKGASTGLSMGGPKGAAIGAAVGAGAGLIDLGRQLYHRNEFRNERERLLTQATQQNGIMDYSNRAMNAMTGQHMSTMDNFYGR